jgi:hypothetical protein
MVSKWVEAVTLQATSYKLYWFSQKNQVLVNFPEAFPLISISHLE